MLIVVHFFSPYVLRFKFWAETVWETL